MKHKIGGERGIRTLDTLPYTHFPGVRLRPLGHFSGIHFMQQMGTFKKSFYGKVTFMSHGFSVLRKEKPIRIMQFK
jgi:hypothetical protein